MAGPVKTSRLLPSGKLYHITQTKLDGRKDHYIVPVEHKKAFDRYLFRNRRMKRPYAHLYAPTRGKLRWAHGAEGLSKAERRRFGRLLK